VTNKETAKGIAATSASGAPDMRIAAIEVSAIRVPLAKIYRGSYYQMSHRSTIVCRVTTQSGIVGEAWTGDEDATLHEIVAIIRKEITPLLIGHDGSRVEACWQKARPATFNILRDRRLGLVACACVDTAIWDAVGKAARMPLWKLWGGFRNSLPMIAIGGYYDDLEIADEISQFKTLGLAGVKFKVGGRSPAVDAERVLRARQAAGADFVICVDANQGYTYEDARQFVRLAAAANIYWFEEPCRWDNDKVYMRDLRASTGIRVCAGQSEFSASACRELMSIGAIDVCNFDASWSGGPTEWRRAAGAAMTFGVLMGHHEEPQVAAHLLCSVPNGTFVECFHPDRDPIWWNLAANRPKLVDGMLTLSDRYGLGWEIDWDYVAKYSVPLRD
jgi:L-alanine-DL-glutamate epimerase-like enolase superfamily enzyme